MSVIFLILSGILPNITAIKYIFTNKYNYVLFKAPLYKKLVVLLDVLIYISLFFITPYMLFPLNKAILFILVPSIGTAGLFYINSQITHIHEDNMEHSNDWYKHQVLTSSNHSLGKTFGFYFSGGLNYQIEHHLFPGVNHCHHPYIYKKIMEICEKHGVRYKAYCGYTDAFTDYYNWLKRLGNDPTLYRAT